MTIRLNKYIAETGVCSRRQADRLIGERRVTVNSVPAGTGAVVGIRCGWGGASGNSYYDVPAPINGGVISLPGLLLEGKFRLRGQYPGLLVPVATNAYGDMVEMEGRLLSKRHLAFAGGQYMGEVIFQLGQEWT